ncbi:hypothetical protein RHMOL_Rhmol07G0265000 [Rhododendron molle]|uniref:Uncharacterized protein n=1 Tax=Rhododendron molle TaxID=49168 RepID=A0ACC0N4Q7_RHOML|nr:hypothetical protein RHMOL_Rhmol07G0265000 [Rhododendron molle]
MSLLHSRLTPNGNMVVALGSTLYALVGIVRNKTETPGEEEEKEFFFTKEEFKACFDFCRDVLFRGYNQSHYRREEEEGWKRAPDMLNVRNRGKAQDALTRSDKKQVGASTSAPVYLNDNQLRNASPWLPTVVVHPHHHRKRKRLCSVPKLPSTSTM